MLAFADMMHFFFDKFTGLSRWCFALALVFLRPLDRFLFRHIVFPAYQTNYMPA